ncbi:hypothetical protein K1T35_47725 (plasmid) [Pseudonocardia sp. DSM 110487]|uniref:hypothetical protein n=1 Tax=Pseudonocardia sp. DSM 110487 TaxID=2865833 RepID=UPI001C69FF8A|nr:hypothetical protein [Pseudonocardia sp. DSM 110487]QYN41041.1 hypothetical protein K1T35_47725 [Pseudonocardia sp. DSM 110487]
MSTNYYLDSPDNDAGHLGLWAAGHFMAKAPTGVNSFEDWAAQMRARRVVTESGSEITPEEMIATALRRWRHASGHRRARYDEGEFVDRGVLFVRREFC